MEPDTRATLVVRDAQLGTERIEVHLVRAKGPHERGPLLLYATGDGGWRSADRGLFHHLALWGYPVAGFSARHYLEHLRSEATTPGHVAEDYAQLIAFAKHELQLPGDTATVLVGFSRGAGLAVVAAGQSELQPVLGGVLAVALTDDEEYVRVRPYDLLPDIGRLPVAVIQSTQDSYLAAAPARRLFGPDGDRRRFHPIHARSHTFAGARESLYEQARAALEWIVACGPRDEAGT